MSVSSSRAALMQAHKRLIERMAQIKPRWDDASRKRFEERFIDPLEKSTVDAVRGLDVLVGLFDAVKRDCSDDSRSD